MIANCPQCAMSLSFDDDRLPTEPFNVLCPRCRQTVTNADPIKALAEMILGGLKQPAAGEPTKWQRRRVVLCLDDPEVREAVRRALDSARYEVFSSDTSPEAVEI